MESNNAEAAQTVSQEPSQSPSTLSPGNNFGNNQNGDNFIVDSTNMNNIGQFSDASSEYSAFSDCLDSLEPKLCLSEEEFKSQGIQYWINSGNVDSNCIVCYDSHEIQALPERGFTQWDLSDGEDIDENDAEIKTPILGLWNFQKELAQNALLGQNTIICAPTGSGKTRVAVHIILNHLQEQPADQKQTRKVVFFARTVPLVHQQFRVLYKFLPKKYMITCLTGDNKYSMQLDMIIPEYDVLVMTPRILENHFIRNPQHHMDQFSMMVFDECHHASKEEPYNTLMLHYMKRKKLLSKQSKSRQQLEIRLPQIVGLTASIGVGKAQNDDQAKDYMLQICGNLDVQNVSCVKENIEELKQKVHVCAEELGTLHERETDDAVTKILVKMKEFEGRIAALNKKLKVPELDNLLTNIPENAKSLKYGHWTVKVKNAARSLPRTNSVEKNGWKRFLLILADYLSTYNIALELHDLVLLRHVMEYLKNCFEQHSENRNCSQDENSYFESFSELQEQLKDKLDTENPNLTLLKNCLLKYLIKKGEDSRGIIFVRTRVLAHALATWLNSCNNQWIESLRATVFTGSSASAVKGGMTTAQQSSVIQDFKTGRVRILVATSVAEEGIDIPECNLVIKYNHAGNEISYMQAKGRSRKCDGVSVILAMSKIIEKEQMNKRKAEMMERALTQLQQMDPTEIKKEIEAHQQRVLMTVRRARGVQKHSLKRQHFRMVCHGCGDVVIDSNDIRTICETHHVVINREIMKQTKSQIEEVKSFDDMRKIGPVICMGRLKSGQHCKNKLGTMMIFSNIAFVVLGLKKKRFGFESVDHVRLQTYNNWKEVPYIVNEIGPQDYQRYVPELMDTPADDSDGVNDLNKTLEEINSDEKNHVETSSNSLQSNTTLLPSKADNTTLLPSKADNSTLLPSKADNTTLLPSKADNVRDEQKVYLSTDSDSSKASTINRTENLNTFQQPDSSDVNTVTEKNVNTVTEKNSNTVTEKNVNTITENNVNTVTEKNVNTVTEKNVNTVTEKNVNTVTEKNVKTVTEKNVNTVTEKNVNTVTDFTPEKALKDTDSNPRHSSKIASDNLIESRRATLSSTLNELHIRELDVLYAAPSFETHLSSLGPPPLQSEEWPSYKLSLDSNS